MANLLASSLNIRVQACHALGGLVIGCTSIPTSGFHTRIASAVASFVKTIPANTTPVRQTTPPGVSQSPIVKSLRIALNVVEPNHVAQGPVWAITVLTNFVGLLGSVVCTDLKVSRILSSLFQLSLRHKKSTIRSLVCVSWRCVAWAYFQPRLPLNVDEESEVDSDSPDTQRTAAGAREAWLKMLLSVVDMGAGISTVAGFASVTPFGHEGLQCVVTVLRQLMHRTKHSFVHAMLSIKQLVNPESAEHDFRINDLLPMPLLTAIPGVLTSDMTSLPALLRTISVQCPDIADIRPLSASELSSNMIMDCFVSIWKDGFGLYNDLETVVWASSLSGIDLD